MTECEKCKENFICFFCFCRFDSSPVSGEVITTQDIEKKRKELAALLSQTYWSIPSEFCQECKNEKIACVCMGENNDNI